MMNLLILAGLSLAGDGEVTGNTYSNGKAGVRLSVPEKEFGLRTKELRHNYYGDKRLCEFESACGVPGGTLLHYTSGISAADHAAWRERTERAVAGYSDFRRAREFRLEGRGAEVVGLEFTFTYEGVPWHYLHLFVARGRDNFEIIQWVPERHWPAHKRLMYAVIQSFSVVQSAQAALRCVACGVEGKAGRKFCTDCGGRLEAPAAPETGRCWHCDAKYEGQERFCAGCGETRGLETRKGCRWIEEGKALFDQGFAHDQAGRWKEAEETYTKVIAVSPQFEFVWNNRGWMRHNLGRYEDALSDLNQALKLAPGFTRALRNRAEVFEKLGRFEPALQDLLEVVRIQPDQEMDLRPKIDELKSRIKK